jgi:FtsP/CotA-like multicopper oxidase with cupredoxin domain
MIEAFAEAGKALSTPGPLIRVPRGTEIHVTLRNTLSDKTAKVFGFETQPSQGETPAVVEPGATKSIRFKAGAAGTYYYWATTTDRDLATRDDVDSQLSGAFVVDPKPPLSAANDRVFVLGLWFEPKAVVNGVEKPEREVLVINGKSWPNTERFTFVVGDTVRWRWVNPTTSTHPMHLHGFYYTVMSRGQMSADTIYSASDRRMVNTELMRVGSTMAMTFVPQKPGNWVFHCHFAFHVSSDASLVPPSAEKMDGHDHDMAKAHPMAGLVLGIHVEPRPGQTYASAAGPRRNLRLLLQSSPKKFGDKPAFGFVLQDKNNVPRADSVSFPGPTLVLKRGEPVRITVVNNMKEPGTVHWHGIELESYPDGVPFWSGSGSKLMQPILPADSFNADFTPPRSGTFIYHAHLNEQVQINSGMYGALVVVDDPAKFNPERDKVILVGGGGPPPLPGADTRGFVNGSATPSPIVMNVGETYRLRLINIHPEWRVEFSLGTDTTVAKWRPIAKDGADLPLSQRRVQSAYLLTGPGETADYEYTPLQAGAMRLLVRTRLSGWVVPVDVDVRKKKTLAVR